MTEDSSSESVAPHAYSIPAIAAAVVGVSSLFVTSMPFVATLLAIAAIGLSLGARRQLKLTPGARGFSLSLIGFLAAIWVVLTTGVPSLFAAALVASL
ncbi:hypothetical protein [Mycetocola zhadangensis]|uniref:DUF4190 domain-containing protein n=1 Tax=Mycetocola zhadangensis TaxID=1164595 RepID=A0A3L7JD23_9MICO|nr:hypothetical protein [Mycetocola zhadangensis]RLQ86392.1 hypothetical protein D9V28_06140 [Mycetocola zhadangensis]GGE90824.1 hypothetical protein GCM10011313_12130 [Mycetocola zhadangensis]